MEPNVTKKPEPNRTQSNIGELWGRIPQTPKEPEKKHSITPDGK